MNPSVESQEPATQAPRGLSRLLGSTGISMIGQGVALAAVPLLAASLTRDPFEVSLVGAATYAATLVLGLPAGALVDRWPRRAVMVAADVLRAFLLVALALAIGADALTLPALVGVVFLLSAAGCFFDPAAQAAIPAVAGRDTMTLAKANGRLWTYDVFGRSLVGPPLGAALFAAGAVLPFALNGLTFIASALLLVGLTTLRRPARADVQTSIRHDIREGLRFLAGHVKLRVLTLGMATYNFGYNVAFAPLVLFAQERLDLDARGFGLLLATLAVGGLVGGWLAPRVYTRLSAIATYAACLAVQALAWVAVGLGGGAWAAGAALAFVGVASTVVSAVGGTARQEISPDHLLGRVTAGTRVLGIGSAAVGSVVGGAVGSLAGLVAPLLAAAVVLALGAVLFGSAALRSD